MNRSEKEFYSSSLAKVARLIELHVNFKYPISKNNISQKENGEFKVNSMKDAMQILNI